MTALYSIPNNKSAVISCKILRAFMNTIQPDASGYWLLTQDSALYLINGELPQGKAIDFQLQGYQGMVIGEINQQPVWLVEELKGDERDYTSLRHLLSLPEAHFNILNRGVELNHFFKTHRFCGKCGHATQLADHEWAMQCQNPYCGHRIYPVICPCIIVVVRRGKQLLLANHQRHRGGVYTALAGFVEVGETFEQAVHREVFEETGIKVKNLRYFGSQPWAFPHSAMIGFLADYAGGDLCLQALEIHDAQWFDYNAHLPELPPKGTIALKLIEHTLQLCAKEERKVK